MGKWLKKRNGEICYYESQKTIIKNKHSFFADTKLQVDQIKTKNV